MFFREILCIGADIAASFRINQYTRLKIPRTANMAAHEMPVIWHHAPRAITEAMAAVFAGFHMARVRLDRGITGRHHYENDGCRL